MDGYLSKLRGLASSAANAVQSKIGRDYEADFSARPQGHSGLWTLYKTHRRATRQPATIWVFDKQRFFDRGINLQTLGVGEQRRILELLKTEAAQLTKLRHPSVLQVMEPLEDTRGTMMFVTEQVVASLDDLIKGSGGGRWVVDGEEYELDELEIQKGLLQVSRGLQFLHRDVRIMHGNLQASSVLVDAKGDWKLAGLGFSRPTVDGSRVVSFEHDYGMPEHTQQTLEFLAPEMVVDGWCSATCDVFSLGCLAYALHNRGASPLDCGNDLGAYKRAVAGLQQRRARLELPETLVAVVGSLLSREPGSRMTLEEFQGSAYFDNVLVAGLRYLEAFAAQPSDQKIAFMRGLPRILPQYPVRVLRRKLLPALLDQANDHELLRFTLPNIFSIVEHLAPAEFASLALAGLQPIYAQTGLSAAATVVLLENVGLVQKKMAEDVFNRSVMPLVYSSLGSADPQVQEQALKTVPEISRHLGYADLRDQLLPRVQQLYSRATVLAHKVRALMCLHGMLDSLDKTTVVEKVLPMLRRTKTREPAVVMALVAVYGELAERCLDRLVVAKEVIPELWAILVEARLSLDQFDRLAAVVQRLSKKVTDEQRVKAEEYQRIDRLARADAGGGRDSADGLAVGGGATGDRLVDGALGFESLVRGNGGPSNGSASFVLKNPLAGAAQTAGSAADSSKGGGWEWDAPASSVSASARSNGSVEADLAATDDLFGSFANASLVSSPVLSPPQASGGGRAASRLRTTANAAGAASGGRLGAMKLGSGATTAFGIALLPPPPSSSTASSFGSAKKLPAASVSPAGGRPKQPSMHSSGLSFGQAAILPTAASKPKAQAAVGAQKHAGGKAADLGDFDPFA
ncbi:Protein kinase domain-containing protein ppk32 [Coemansia sp. RSA 2598]|nr:Protein kinase domain-containing protein ppk32 [Coemansia sp. RSA 2598]